MKNLNNIQLLSNRPLNSGNGYGVQPLYQISSDINTM
jgi:hypothetical protein